MVAIQSIKEGRHLIIPERRGFLKRLPKIMQEAGITGPMYHKQNKMFAHPKVAAIGIALFPFGPRDKEGISLKAAYRLIEGAVKGVKEK